MLAEVPKSVITQNVLRQISRVYFHKEDRVSDLAGLERRLKIVGLQETIEQTFHLAEWKAVSPYTLVQTGIELMIGPLESKTKMSYFPETLEVWGWDDGLLRLLDTSHPAMLNLTDNEGKEHKFLEFSLETCAFRNGKIFFYFGGRSDQEDALVFSLRDGQCSIPDFLIKKVFK